MDDKKKIRVEDFVLDEIESIELIGDNNTIDITVEDTHMFFANDIYTHNSSINAETVDSTMIGGSIKKGQIGHFIISVAKDLEQKESGRANVAILKSRFGVDGIIFNDIEFNNGTVQINIDDGNYLKASEMESYKEEKNNETIANLMNHIASKKENKKEL